MEALEKDYITIANNVPRIYEAGWKKVLDNAESLKGTLSGKAVRADDVIDLNCNVPCQLTSDTVTDFSSVKVSKYGKNLFNQDLWLKHFSGIDADGWYVWGRNLNFGVSYRVDVNLPANKYTLRAKVKSPDTAQYLPMVYYADGTTKKIYINDCVYDNTDGSYIATINTNGKAISQLGFNYNNGEKNDVRFKDWQIELGSTASSFEPYIAPQTVTANADGTVDGITSIAPSMTLLTDTDGVVINASYYKDPDIVVTNILQSIALSGGDE